jgi:hypothetical protein
MTSVVCTHLDQIEVRELPASVEGCVQQPRLTPTSCVRPPGPTKPTSPIHAVALTKGVPTTVIVVAAMWV